MPITEINRWRAQGTQKRHNSGIHLTSDCYLYIYTISECKLSVVGICRLVFFMMHNATYILSCIWSLRLCQSYLTFGIASTAPFRKFPTDIHHKFLVTQLISMLSYSCLWVKLISIHHNTCKRKWTKTGSPSPPSFSVHILLKCCSGNEARKIQQLRVNTINLGPSTCELLFLFLQWFPFNVLLYLKPTYLRLSRFYWTSHKDDKKHVWHTMKFQTTLKECKHYTKWQKCVIKSLQ